MRPFLRRSFSTLRPEGVWRRARKPEVRARAAGAAEGAADGPATRSHDQSTTAQSGLASRHGGRHGEACAEWITGNVGFVSETRRSGREKSRNRWRRKPRREGLRREPDVRETARSGDSVRHDDDGSSRSVKRLAAAEREADSKRTRERRLHGHLGRELGGHESRATHSLHGRARGGTRARDGGAHSARHREAGHGHGERSSHRSWTYLRSDE